MGDLVNPKYPRDFMARLDNRQANQKDFVDDTDITHPEDTTADYRECMAHHLGVTARGKSPGDMGKRFQQGNSPFVDIWCRDTAGDTFIIAASGTQAYPLPDYEDGDLILIFVGCEHLDASGAPTITDAGWTADATNPVVNNAAGDDTSVYCFYRVVGGGFSDTTFTIQNNTLSSFTYTPIAASFANVHADIFDVALAADGTKLTNTYDPNFYSKTSVTDGAMYVAYAHYTVSGCTQYPSMPGFTRQWDDYYTGKTLDMACLWTSIITTAGALNPAKTTDAVPSSTTAECTQVVRILKKA